MPRPRHFRASASHDAQPFSWEFSHVPVAPSEDIETSPVVAWELPPTRPGVLKFALEELVSASEAIDELSAAVAPQDQGFADAVGEVSTDATNRLTFDSGSPALTDEFGAATVSLQVRLGEPPALSSPDGARAAAWWAGTAPMQALDILPSQYGTSFAAHIVPVAHGIHALDCAAGDGGNGFAATAADASAPMPCCSCCIASDATKEGGSDFDDFVTSGTKWGTSGLGTSGGTVTWSIAGAGLTNATGQGFFSGTTVTMSSVFSFDFEAVLTQAFAAWSTVANITFVRVADGGGNIGVGSSAYIRMCAGFIDGSSNVLARAFYPVTNGNAHNHAVSGDAVFDSGETTFWTASSLLAVATHEIGHSIGLNHATVTNALMAPYYNPSITAPQADDIAGARAIYGTAGAATGSVSISDVSISEGNAGTKTMTFTVMRTGGSAAFSVNYATANNTATAGSDYVARSGTLSFGTGVNSQTFTVTINGDITVELNERFFVNLSGATNGAAIADGEAVGTISNDDVASGGDDFADSRSDTSAPFGQVNVGGSATGNLETAGDRDWFRVTLTAGIAYTFQLAGSPSSAGTLADPYLYLYNSSGGVITVNDDTATRESSITHTPATSGTYYLGAGAYNDAYTGTYQVSATRSQILVNGDANNNKFIATAATEAFDGRGGEDTVSYANQPGPNGVTANLANPSVNTGFAADDTYTSIENLIGSSRDDRLTGDTLDNALQGGGGADVLDGGDGNDEASYAGAPTGVTANLSNPNDNTGDAAGDSYISIEWLTGSRHDDILTGDDGRNRMLGRDGNDVLSGGINRDVLIGGAGRDTFIFASRQEDRDHVKDFVSGEDLVGIVRAGYNIDARVSLGVGGVFDFTDHYFVSKTTGAADETGHGQFIFNQATDQLLWDPDGLGSRAAELVITFGTDVNLRAADFVLT